MKVHTPDAFEPVNGNRIIWRYMPLDKFLHLLLNRELTLVKASLFTDRNEFCAYLRAAEDRTGKLIAQGRLEEADKCCDRNLKIENAIEGIKRKAFINCWSIGTEESYALWKIYLSGSASGVAIRTTVSKLKKSITSSNEDSISLYLGEVTYDHPKFDQEISDHHHILTKGHAYKYEEELRLYMIQETEEPWRKLSNSFTKGAHSISIDTETLIQEAVISPFCGEWFADTLKKVVDQSSPGLADRFKFSRIQDN